MGQTNSKGGIPMQACEQDLHWILNENVKWTERASAARLLLDGRVRPQAETIDDLDGLDRQNAKVFREVDAILTDGFYSTAPAGTGTTHTRTSLLGAGGMHSSTTSTSAHHGLGGLGHHGTGTPGSESQDYGLASNTDIFDMERPIPLPLSHPAHQLQASQTFGAAAAKEVILMNNKSSASQQPHEPAQVSEWTRTGIDSVSAAAHAAWMPPPIASTTRTGSISLSSGIESGASTPTERRLSFDPAIDHSALQTQALPITNASLATGSGATSTLPATNPHEPLPPFEQSHTLMASTGSAPTNLTGSSEGMGAGSGADGSYTVTSVINQPDVTATSSYGYTVVEPNMSGATTSSTHPVVTNNNAAIVDASKLQHGIDAKAAPGGSMLPAGAGAAPHLSDTTATSTLDVPYDGADATKERVELATKYLYVHGLLQKMIQAAQLSYQVSLQLEGLRKKLKPKRTIGVAPVLIEEMRAQQAQKFEVLRNSRELFLKSRLTLQWFYADFFLNYSLHLLHDSELLTRQQRTKLEAMHARLQEQELAQGLAMQDPSLSANSSMSGLVPHQQPQYGPSYGNTLPSQVSAHGLAEMDRTLSAIESRRSAIELRLLANERYALSIAHYYLAKQSQAHHFASGQPITHGGVVQMHAQDRAAHAPAGLTQADVPEMASGLFRLLDVHNFGVVTREQLHVGLQRLARQLDEFHVRVRALQMHNETLTEGAGVGKTGGQNSNVIAANTTKLQRLQQELATTRTNLRAIHHFFLATFTRNIFVNLDAADLPLVTTSDAKAVVGDAVPTGSGTLEAEAIDVPSLRAELATLPLDTAVLKPVNPLDVANEGRVGPDEPVKDVATGLPAEHVAHAAAPTTTAASTTTETTTAAPTTTAVLDASNPRAMVATGQLPPPSPAHADLLLRRASRSLPPTPNAKKVAVLPTTTAASPGSTAAPVAIASQQEIGIPSTGVTSSITSTTIPMSDAPVNGALAPKLHASELQLQHEHLAHVSEAEVRPSASGGVHPVGAPVTDQAVGLAEIVDPLMLKHAAHQLTPIAECVTPSVFGGQHDRAAAIVTESVRTLPLVEEHAAMAMPAPTQPAETIAASAIPVTSTERPLLSVVDNTPQQAVADVAAPAIAPIVQAAPVQTAAAPAETVPMNGALAKVVRREQLSLASTALHHVSLRKAQITPSGGVHALTKANMRLIPEALFAPEHADAPVNFALARRVQADALLTSKAHLKSTPNLFPSSFGGHHSHDAFLPLTADATQLKSALQEQAHHLAHVPTEKQIHTMSGGVHMNPDGTLATTIMDKLKTLVGLEPSHPHGEHAPELGHVVDTAHPLSARAQARPVEAVHRGTSLAPILNIEHLQKQASSLHHVDIGRIEMKRDLAAGVGQVTTRKASYRRPRPPPQPEMAEDALAAEYLVQPASSDPTPPSVGVMAAQRLPHVVGRSSATSSASSSRAESPARPFAGLQTVTDSTSEISRAVVLEDPALKYSSAAVPLMSDYNKVPASTESGLVDKDRRQFDVAAAQERPRAI